MRLTDGRVQICLRCKLEGPNNAGKAVDVVGAINLTVGKNAVFMHNSKMMKYEDSK